MYCCLLLQIYLCYLWLLLCCRDTYMAFVCTHHVHHLRIDGLGDDVPVVSDVLHHLAERRPLHLFPFQVAQGVGDEVEENAALTQLLHE